MSPFYFGKLCPFHRAKKFLLSLWTGGSQLDELAVNVYDYVPIIGFRRSLEIFAACPGQSLNVVVGRSRLSVAILRERPQIRTAGLMTHMIAAQERRRHQDYCQ